MMSKYFHAGLATVFAGSLTVLSMAAPTPVLEFTFNDTGTTTANSGSLTSVTDALMVNGDGTATDLHSAGGGGLTGDTSDRAFENSRVSDTQGGRVYMDQTPADLDGASAVTITGWYKTAYAGSSVATGQYLVDMGYSTGYEAGVNVMLPSRNRVLFNVYGEDGQQTLITADDAFAETQSWVFFAVTYDSTVSGQANMKIYKGTDASHVTLVEETEAALGALNVTPNKEFTIGNASGSTARPLDGYMDNIRIYDNALGQEELETVRTSEIPEPATLAWVTMGLLGLLSARSR